MRNNEEGLSRMAVRVETVQGVGPQSQSTRSMRHWLSWLS